MRQPLQLIPGAHHGQTLAQVVLRDFLSLASDPLDRLQGPPHEHEAARHRHAYGNGQSDGHEQQNLTQGRSVRCTETPTSTT